GAVDADAARAERVRREIQALDVRSAPVRAEPTDEVWLLDDAETGLVHEVAPAPVRLSEPRVHDREVPLELLLRAQHPLDVADLLAGDVEAADVEVGALGRDRRVHRGHVEEEPRMRQVRRVNPGRELARIERVNR